MTKIILSADSTCDLGDELKAKYQVHYYPFHIILGDKQYQDNVDITPEEIFQAYWERKILPKTAAIGVGEYLDYFRKWVENGYQVIHLAPEFLPPIRIAVWRPANWAMFFPLIPGTFPLPSDCWW